MKTKILIFTSVRTFRDPSMIASGVTKVSRFHDPYTGEIGVEDFNNAISDVIEFFIKTARSEKTLHQAVNAFNLVHRSLSLGNLLCYTDYVHDFAI
jgi:hypothetical protein